MTRAQKRDAQRELNRWTKKYAPWLSPLHVDGIFGKATRRRIQWVKYLCGFGNRVTANSSAWTSRLVRSMRHTRTPRRDGQTRHQVNVGIARRRREKAAHRRNVVRSVVAPGVTRWGGVPVARCAVCHLNDARRRGWRGGLNSGWRSPAYSDSLCYRMCRRPRCPGRCAGSSSNHSGSTCARFAIDVSAYGQFGQLMRSSRCRPRIFNALGSRDPVHYSPQGN